ncbi:MAG: DNA-directed DNA polymerase [Candidatus Aenigmarchaeota archaeon]|nr:DNA-directed DNA polymerase [Candidatus Aenigmarchaeota archaeon]
MRFCLLDADYEIRDGKPIIRLFGVDAKGKALITKDDYQPYFYVLPKNKDKLKEKLNTIKMVRGIEEVKRKLGLDEREFLKVFVDLPQNVPLTRDEIKHSPLVEECYEYSVNFYKRYLMDKKFYPLDWLEADDKNIIKVTGGMPKLKVLAFDIEVVDGKIIMVSIADNDGCMKLLTYKKAKNAEVLKNEGEMIKRFVKLVNDNDPDIIVTYNGDGYDFEMLRKQADTYKIDLAFGRDKSSVKFAKRAHMSSARIFGRVHIDLFKFVDNILSPQLQSEIFTLNEVATELIGEGKDELSMEDIIRLWKSDVDRLAEYCRNDSLLTVKLAQKMLPQIFELSKLSGQLPFDCSRLTYGLLVEWFLVRKANELGYIVPNQPHWNEIQKRRELRPYKGGHVIEPRQGLHDNIAVFDFRSLYPSVIVTYNISPETLNCKCCKGGHKVPESKNYFCRKRQGFVSGLVKELIDRRMKIKEMMKTSGSDEKKQLDDQQKAVKIIANAAYGFFAYAGARWYCRECAEAAAAFGRESIKQSISAAEDYGFDVLYGDTDSLFVKLKRDGNIEKEAGSFLEKINKGMPGMIELELQGIYKRGLFVPQKIGAYTAKKRYALIDNNGKLLVRGLETVRRNWCDAARHLQHDVLRLVLNKKEKDAVRLVKETVERVSRRCIDIKDLVIRTQLGKSLVEYKATGPHVALARKLEKEGHIIREGMVMSYVITKGKGSIAERAEPSDKVKLDDYDVDYYLNHQIIPVALRVLQVLGYTENDFLKKESLKKFVKY